MITPRKVLLRLVVVFVQGCCKVAQKMSSLYHLTPYVHTKMNGLPYMENILLFRWYIALHSSALRKDSVMFNFRFSTENQGR